ncbi:MAG TPA: MlaD family protein [Candidatus Binataceae bacterium]|nr:MlaD family protein [Candidatus Binataceae bacterium]
MRRRPSARLVGAFVLGAVALAIAAVAVLGSGRLFRKTHPFILVFRGNVNGLRVGAPVKIKGVTIGSVTDIQLRLNIAGVEQTASTGGIQIPVLIQIDVNRVKDFTISRDVRIAVDRGLRAQLAMESFVTGILYIDLDMHPGTPKNYAMPPGSTPQEIPTLKTTFEQAQSAAAKIISQLDKIQLDQLINTTNQTIAAFGDLARSPDVRSALVSLNQTATSLGDTAQSIRDLTEHVDRQVGPMAASIEKGARDIDLAVQKAQVALDRIQAGLEPNAPLVYRANLALENVSAAARSLKELGDYLQRNPSAIVRGRYFGNQ